jgi:hypothetical protein
LSAEKQKLAAEKKGHYFGSKEEAHAFWNEKKAVKKAKYEFRQAELRSKRTSTVMLVSYGEPKGFARGRQGAWVLGPADLENGDTGIVAQSLPASRRPLTIYKAQINWDMDTYKVKGEKYSHLWNTVPCEKLVEGS